MVFTYQIPRAAAASGGSGAGVGPSGPEDYPYSVPASLYPLASNMTALSNVTEVAATAVPSTVAAYGVLLASRSSNTTWALSFDEAEFSSSLAYQVAVNGTCGPGCGDLPLAWTAPYAFASFSSNITGLGLGTMGTTFVGVATAAN